MKNDRIKNGRIKSDRIKSGRIKSGRIKTDRIKSITDPLYSKQCFGSGSTLDPHSISFLDPDPRGVKSDEIAGKNKAKSQIIHHKKLI
jgi:hypothetical protein